MVVQNSNMFESFTNTFEQYLRDTNVQSFEIIDNNDKMDLIWRTSELVSGDQIKDFLNLLPPEYYPVIFRSFIGNNWIQYTISLVNMKPMNRSIFNPLTNMTFG